MPRWICVPEVQAGRVFRFPGVRQTTGPIRGRVLVAGRLLPRYIHGDLRLQMVRGDEKCGGKFPQMMIPCTISVLGQGLEAQ
jgi:hypothetical protein